jgi:hypothetical protein
MSLEVVKSLENQVISAQNKYQIAQNNLTEAIALAKEYERQAEVHRSNGAWNDLQNVNSLLNNQYLTITSLTGIKDSAKMVVDDLTNQLTAAKAALTPAENQVIQAEAAVKVNESNMRLAAQQAEIDKKNYAQKTTKYIVIGVIGLIVIGGIIYYFRKKAK